VQQRASLFDGLGSFHNSRKAMVKVERRPTSLLTVMSPPIISQKRLLIASPSPIPPRRQRLVPSLE
jgi:hypothetical protein